MEGRLAAAGAPGRTKVPPRSPLIPAVHAAHRRARATLRARRPSARARQRCTAAPLYGRCPRCCRGLEREAGRGRGPFYFLPSSQHLGPGASFGSALAHRAGPGGAGASVRVRERRPPLPRPALLGGPGRRGHSGGAAPRERQVRERPTRGQWAWGRDRGPSRL